MKHFYLSLLLLIAAMASLSGGFTAASAENAPEPFRSFAENAEGRYFTSTSEGTAVLELIPAFGRLFASVGYYMGERSLYSYYAAELIPVCRTEDPGCTGNASGSSFDVSVRLFSNMAMAGTYWPGETRQRLTLVPGGLLLSNYIGEGDALISKGSTLLERNGSVPGMFPYGPAEADRMAGNDGVSGIPAALTGSFSAVLQDEGKTASVWISLDRDGTILMLRDQEAGDPPLLLKGGFSASEGEDGSYRLCWLMSSPSSGQMPYSGCVNARMERDRMVVSHSQDNDDDLMLPYNAAEMVYVRDQREADGR